jgi:MFS family permease
VSGNIPRLLLSSFLAGFILWYGVDKLYLTTLGLGAFAVGLAVIVLQVCTVIFEVPAGFISDGWSRRGVLRLSMSFLVAAAVLMGAGQPISDLLGVNVVLGVYLVGVACYGLHVTTWYSTADALMYDTLIEVGDKDADGQPVAATRLCGRLYAVNLAGYAVASLIGGFYARAVYYFLDYYWVFFIAAIPAVIGLGLTWKLQEPSFRQATETPKQSLKQAVASRVALVRQGSGIALASPMIKPLMVVMMLLCSVGAFKEGFGQLFFLRFVPNSLGWLTAPIMASLLFGVFYAVWACGELRAHKYDGRVHRVVVLSTVPMIVVATACVATLVTPWASLVVFGLYLVQAYYAAMLFRQISNEIHKATASDVRDSVMSVQSTIGRLAWCAVLFVVTVLVNRADMIWAVLLVASFALAALIFWIDYRRRTSGTDAVRTQASEHVTQPQLATELVAVEG